MRFLGIGDTCDLGAMYLQLAYDGHEVCVYSREPMAQGTLAGLIRKTAAWRDELGWIKAGGPEGLIIFENVAHASGAQQDDLRRQGFNVIGGSAWGDRLENDRSYAQGILASLGLQTARVNEFKDIDDGLRFIQSNPSRYVLKFNGPGLSSADNYVGEWESGADVAAMLQIKRELLSDRETGFVLMQHIAGIEMGVGAYFNGKEFLEPACLDWEHKRFFPGDLGELTGEMGTVATFDGSDTFFSATLKKLAPLLREHGYRGYINLNTIVNEQGVWPLEFTCRFGYPGYAVLTPLQTTRWGALLHSIAHETKTFVAAPGFSVGIVLTTPPFPYDRKVVNEAVGLPVMFRDALTNQELGHVHYGEIGLAGDQLVTSGLYGWSMVVTGTGPTIPRAQKAALELAAKVHIPNVRYRRDIGDKLRLEEWGRLKALEWVN